LNEKSKDIDIAPYNELEAIFSKETVLANINRKIERAKIDVQELERRRDYFLNNFATAFTPSVVEEAATG
jgi:hypothetical protein